MGEKRTSSLLISIAVSLLVLPLFVFAIPGIIFLVDTPSSNTFTSQTNIEINISILESSLGEVKFNWNGTNHTIYDDSLVFSMNFNNISSIGENDTQTVDVSTYGHVGIPTGALWIPAGKYEGAYNFTPDSYINISNDPSLNLSNRNFTIIAWIYPQAGHETSPRILDKRGASGPGWNFALDQSVQKGLNFNDGTDHTSDPEVWEYDRWTQVAVAFNGTDLNFYSNSTPWGSAAYSGAPSTTMDMFVGMRHDTLRSFAGRIDEIRIWNRSLSAAEIQQMYFTNLNKYNTNNWTLYINQSLNSTDGLAEGTYSFSAYAKNGTGSENATETRTITIDTTLPTISFVSPPTPLQGSSQQSNDSTIDATASDSASNISIVLNFDNSLLSWWRMDDLNATGDVVDYIDNYNGSVVGDAYQTVSGYMGKAFVFDGNQDYIEMLGTSTGALDFPEYGNYTLAAWAKTKGHHRNQAIVGKSEMNYRLTYGMNGHWRFVEHHASGPWDSVTTPGALNKWAHVVGVRNGTGMQLYVNGTLMDDTVTTGAYALGRQSVNVMIGRDGTDYGEAFNGTIDDVMIFNRSISSEEVAALYANQTSKYSSLDFNQLSGGSHSFKAYVQDRAGNVETTEQRTFTISRLAAAVYGQTLQLILRIDNLVNDVYIPGTGTIASASITNTSYASPTRWYLASYLSNVLNALIFSYQNPAELRVTRDSTQHSLTLSQDMQNSKSLLVFSSGDWVTVDNRMELIESGEFMNKISPSFARGMGTMYVIKILLGYINLDISDDFIVGAGYRALEFENAGVKDGKIRMNVSIA